MNCLAASLLAQALAPHLEVRPEVQRLLDTAPQWPGWVLVFIALLWVFALICIPFFLWGIYNQSHKQTRLLRDVVAELRRSGKRPG